MTEVETVRAKRDALSGLLGAEYRMSVLLAYLEQRGHPRPVAHRAVVELIHSGQILWTPDGYARLS